jgi:predicted signal transduction protein with EAL and GGDEF domain
MVQALLQAMGCDLAQGYFIARPMALEDLAEFLQLEAAGESGRDAIGRKTARRSSERATAR